MFCFSVCKTGIWDCSVDEECISGYVCPHNQIYRTTVRTCNNTCSNYHKKCPPDASVYNGCGCPSELVLNPKVRKNMPKLNPKDSHLHYQ